ncbi:MAG: thiol reductant ABC exporter subunit CydC [Actinomycetes bacterium]
MNAMNPTRRMWAYFADKKWPLAAAVALSATTTISTVGLMATSGWLIARASQMPPVLDLSIAVVSVRTFALLRSISRYSERLISHDATFSTLTTIRTRLFDALEKLAPSGMSTFRRGDLLSRIVSDVDEIQNLPLRVVIPVASGILSGLASVILSFLIYPPAGIILLVALAMSATLVPWLTTRNGRIQEQSVSDIRGALHDEILEYLNGQADLVTLQAEETVSARITDIDSQLTASSVSLATATGIASGLTALIQGLTVITSSYVAIRACEHGELNTVLLIVIGLIPLAAFESVQQLPQAMLTLSRVHGSATRLVEILDAPIPDVELGDTQVLVSLLDSAQDTSNSTVTPKQTSHGLELQDVSASWPGTDRHAVSDVSFVVPPMTSIALVGRSGSGKSTIASLLVKFLSPRSGRYLVGGIDSRAISGETLRSHIVLSGQDSHVFATSIRENLMIAVPHNSQQVSDDDLRDALEEVELGDWLRSQPQELDTMIGERGITMSGGQRQRLLLARMILAAPEVWVLDEPTEHLDSDLADRMMSTIKHQQGSSTLVIATHRLLDTIGIDTVLLLDNGRVIEQGSPEGLTHKNQHYSKILSREFVARTKQQDPQVPKS